jgi:hypothetical protein
MAWLIAQSGYPDIHNIKFWSLITGLEMGPQKKPKDWHAAKAAAKRGAVRTGVCNGQCGRRACENDANFN